MKNVITILLLALLMPTITIAHDFKVNGIYYLIINENEVAVTYANYGDSKSYSGDVIIPPSVTNYNGLTYSVTSIGRYSFRNCDEVTSVIIPNSIRKINDEAFKGCSKLTSITIPESVTSIGDAAFNDCYRLDTLNYNAVSCADFNSSYKPFTSSISTINIGNMVERIPAHFASGLNQLTSITIPNSVTEIGASAFSRCFGMLNVYITDLVSWCNISFKSTGSNPLSSAHHLYLNGLEVTDLTIPNTLNSIGNYVFEGCTGLSNVTIPNSVTIIGNSAFSSCSGLTQINIPNSVTTIGDHAFSKCTGLTSVIIPNSVTTIGISSFSSCSGLTQINIPNSVTTIGDYAFSQCTGLTSVTIPNSVTTICSWFNNCTGLTSVTIPNSVTALGSWAFEGCSGLTSIEIPNSVTEIGSYAFYNCTGLINVNIPNSVIKIHNSAFENCTGLTSITIGNSVSSIGNNAFINATSIEKITCFATTPPLWDDTAVFSVNVYNHAQLHVQIGSERNYKADPNWGQFITIIGDVNGDNPSDDSDYMKCDVNGDGEVNIADVNRVIDAILSH